MTDLQMCALCARAVGVETDESSKVDITIFQAVMLTYNPLVDGNQLMVLVERFDIRIERDYVALVHQDWTEREGLVTVKTCAFESRARIARAIVICVALMQRDKEASKRYV